MSRLSIEISAKQHQHIKASAALEGKSMKEYVMNKLFAKDRDDDEAYKEFNSFMKNRIDEVREGALSERTASQIAEDVLGNTTG